MGERLSPYTFAALYGTSKVCVQPEVQMDCIEPRLA
jgi:hypothetical protein